MRFGTMFLVSLREQIDINIMCNIKTITLSSVTVFPAYLNIDWFMAPFKVTAFYSSIAPLVTQRKKKARLESS